MQYHVHNLKVYPDLCLECKYNTVEQQIDNARPKQHKHPIRTYRGIIRHLRKILLQSRQPNSRPLEQKTMTLPLSQVVVPMWRYYLKEREERALLSVCKSYQHLKRICDLNSTVNYQGRATVETSTPYKTCKRCCNSNERSTGMNTTTEWNDGEN